jgi:hypothetical protein
MIRKKVEWISFVCNNSDAELNTLRCRPNPHRSLSQPSGGSLLSSIVFYQKDDVFCVLEHLRLLLGGDVPQRILSCYARRRMFEGRSLLQQACCLLI